MAGFDKVRVRIAPSPTGDPHVGTAYVALFNYVFAKKHGGEFILRIEDTDQARAKASSEGMITDSLRWLGLQWDEGPDVGGPFGPYRQSERRDIYVRHAQDLLERGHAYRCFCTAERLEDMRREQREKGLSGYDRLCRGLPQGDIDANLAAGLPFVIRLKMPREGVTTFVDKLRGQVEFENERLDDQILIKSDGFPTYHLANVVDDHLMKISHVIRAEEWISSTPKHVALYRAFGWDEPTWVHLPLLRNADRSKISKRKNPVSLTYYRRAGILPHALVNFLGLMGWSFGNDIEIFTLPQMIERFDFKDVSLGGPVFDLVKLTWMNQQYLHKLTAEQFVSYIRDQVFTPAYLTELYPLVSERMARFEQFVDVAGFFFNGALDYRGLELVPKGKTREDVTKMLTELVERLDELYEWTADRLKTLMDEHKAALGWKPRDYFMTVRLVVTGRPDSPPLVESMAAVGREMVRFRIRDCLLASTSVLSKGD